MSLQLLFANKKITAPFSEVKQNYFIHIRLYKHTTPTVSF